MALQSEFKKFHDNIKLDFDTNKELAEKRDILINKLKDKVLSFDTYNQGSYAMHTGIKPENGEYDIDVALIFSVNDKEDCELLTLKEQICTILKNHTDYGAEIKTPCVTVTYKKDGEAAYHVDLVVYFCVDNQYYILKGKESQGSLEQADPKSLVEYINNKIEEKESKEQFRRVVRYIKKWKNTKFSTTGHANPPSIGITLMTVDNFIYHENDDLEALLNIVNVMIYKFGDDNRINLSLPSDLKFEKCDIFKKMTDGQMKDFKERLIRFKEQLKNVKNEADEYEQLKILNCIFGDDFELSEEEEVAKKQSSCIVSSSVSG